MKSWAQVLFLIFSPNFISIPEQSQFIRLTYVGPALNQIIQLGDHCMPWEIGWATTRILYCCVRCIRLTSLIWKAFKIFEREYLRIKCMTSLGYIKVEHIRASVLSSILATFQQFYFQLSHLGAVCVTGLFGLGYKGILLSFSSEISRRSFRETHFRRSFIFCIFICNHEAFNLQWQFLDLPASVTMTRPTKTSEKLKICRLDFRVRFFCQI